MPENGEAQTNNHDPQVMEPFIESIYLREIMLQAEAGIRAIMAFNESLSGDNPDVYAAHDFAGDFLNRAAIISKILKPGGKSPQDRRRVRGRYLRGNLGLPDNSVMLDRTLRDLLEHIDEQIDAWAAAAPDRCFNFVDKTAVPPGSIQYVGVPEVPSLRNSDPQSKKYSVLGASFDLQAIVNAVQDIRKKSHERYCVLRESLKNQ